LKRNKVHNLLNTVYRFSDHDCKFIVLTYVLDPDKNFALEVYGENSKCFDHTNQMWEEQTCKQVRQWQHWGSGCYEYICQNGRLHIIVSFFQLKIILH